MPSFVPARDSTCPLILRWRESDLSLFTNPLYEGSRRKAIKKKVKTRWSLRDLIFLLLEKASLKRLFLSFAKDGRPIYSTTDDGHKWFKGVQSSPGEERELQIPTLYDHKTRSKIKECGLPLNNF